MSAVPPAILVDSNVILDIVTQDPHWFEWSSDMLRELAESSILLINTVIYAEVSVRFNRIEDLDAALPKEFFHRAEIPWAAAFLAGKCFLKYRKQGGQKTAPLPDFFIGAHAVTSDIPLLTRDARRYRTYFPKIEMITPRRNPI